MSNWFPAPPFVKQVRGFWCLAQDNATTPEVEKANDLAWDTSFIPCVEALGLVKGPRTIVDVGAYIGDSTLWFYKNWNRIIAIEPQRDALTCLLNNLGNIGVDILPFPVGNGEFVDLDTGEGGNTGARRVKAGNSIRTIRIDDLGLRTLDFLKIDVEGWEPNVLAGSKETLARCKPLVRVEFNKAALDAAGFTYDDIAKYFEGWRAEEVSRYSSEQWDTLYFPPGK